MRTNQVEVHTYKYSLVKFKLYNTSSVLMNVKLRPGQPNSQIVVCLTNIKPDEFLKTVDADLATALCEDAQARSAFVIEYNHPENMMQRQVYTARFGDTLFRAIGNDACSMEFNPTKGAPRWSVHVNLRGIDTEEFMKLLDGDIATAIANECVKEKKRGVTYSPPRDCITVRTYDFGIVTFNKNAKFSVVMTCNYLMAKYDFVCEVMIDLSDINSDQFLRIVNADLARILCEDVIEKKQNTIKYVHLDGSSEEKINPEIPKEERFMDNVIEPTISETDKKRPVGSRYFAKILNSDELGQILVTCYENEVVIETRDDGDCRCSHEFSYPSNDSAKKAFVKMDLELAEDIVRGIFE